MSDTDLPGVLTSLGSDPSMDSRRMASEVVKAAAAAGHQLYYVWGSGATGDHHLGRAIDFMVYDKGEGVRHPGPERPSVGEWIANYVWENRERLGVRYEIYNRRIRSTTGTPPNVWLHYGGSDPHTNHVHVSRSANAPAYKPKAIAKPAAKPKGSSFPAKGWVHVSVKGDKYPWINGRTSPSTATTKNLKKGHVRKDGFNIRYVKKETHGGYVWVKTAYNTWYRVGNDLVLGKKAK